MSHRHGFHQQRQEHTPPPPKQGSLLLALVLVLLLAFAGAAVFVAVSSGLARQWWERNLGELLQGPPTPTPAVPTATPRPRLVSIPVWSQRARRWQDLQFDPAPAGGAAWKEVHLAVGEVLRQLATELPGLKGWTVRHVFLGEGTVTLDIGGSRLEQADLTAEEELQVLRSLVSPVLLLLPQASGVRLTFFGKERRVFLRHLSGDTLYPRETLTPRTSQENHP